MRTDRTTWLRFSPIEQQFYIQTARSCSEQADRIFNRYPDKSIRLDELHRDQLDELVRPLVALRRCTVHPTVRSNDRLVFTGRKR